MKQASLTMLRHYVEIALGHELPGETGPARTQQCALIMFIMLMNTAEPNKDVTITAIHKWSNVNKSNISHNVAALEKKGIITKTTIPNPNKRGSIDAINFAQDKTLETKLLNEVKTQIAQMTRQPD